MFLFVVIFLMEIIFFENIVRKSDAIFTRVQTTILKYTPIYGPIQVPKRFAARIREL